MHNFQVDLRGVVDLLSKHLYSSPNVYVRELLQNAVDAITARRAEDAAHEGYVAFELTARTADRPPVLAVTDDGIGLTEEEVHLFLATIGRSSKREAELREDFIGQFGIGLLSGFLVASEITVVTRSARDESAPAVKWTGHSDGTYHVETLSADIAPGTQVYLTPKPGCDDFFDPRFLLRTVKRFGSLLPIPVDVSVPDVESDDGGRTTERINEVAPWREQYHSDDERVQALLAYGREVFEIDFADAIPLSSEVGGVEGVAFVLPFSAGLASKQPHRVYLKNMLLAERADNLLPDWAFFVRCVLNVNDLRPTASRESFHDDDVLDEARDALGARLRDYLVRTAETDRLRLERLIALHDLAFKSIALEDDDFFRMFVDWLPFETSLGRMTIPDVLEHEPVVRYVTTPDKFRQVSGVAAAQGICIVNAGYALDTELVERMPHVLPERSIERVDVGEMSREFEELTLAERESVLDFLKLVDVVLQPFQCTGDLRKFAPHELPALYTTNAEADFLRSVEKSKETADDMWSGILENVSRDAVSSAYASLCLNYENPLIFKLTRLRDPELIRRSVEMLYVQALLLGHFPLRAREMEVLNDGLSSLVDLAISSASGDEPST